MLIGGYVLIYLIAFGFFAIIAAPSLIYLINFFITSNPSSFTSGIETFLSSTNFLMFLLPIVFGAIVGITLLAVLEFGYLYMAAKLINNKKISVKDIFTGTKLFWKRALVYYAFSIGIVLALFSPVIVSLFLKILFVSSILIIVSAISLVVVFFFLVFWSQCIVLYDIGVIEGAKRSYRKVRKNILNTIILMIIIAVLGIAIGFTENLIPLIPTILFAPFVKLVYLDACKRFKEK